MLVLKQITSMEFILLKTLQRESECNHMREKHVEHGDHYLVIG